ncbi:unnamed protein product, partial [Echinostoma caproni]|uniref:Peptidase A2 domain-containing protein n=1 Tax=Echinostoma caproni TaxID=27848 RepID=A0A183BA67_9TREM
MGFADITIITATPRRGALHRSPTTPNRETDKPTGSGNDRVLLATTISLFFVTDRHTGIRSLVYTGAQISLIRRRPAEIRRLSTVALVGEYRAPNKIYGERSLTLNLCIRRSLPRVFIIADFPQSVIGMDFLRHFNLMVDLIEHKLIDRLTTCENHGTPTTVPSTSPLLYDPDVTDEFRAVLSEFLELYKSPETLP